jgi:hypothetical protein
MIRSGRRHVRLVLVLIAIATLLLPALSAKLTYATGELEPRSLTLQASGSNGGSQPNVSVNHLFSFTTATTGNVGSIQFLYCTIASGTCVTPTGLISTSATMGTQTGATGFTLVNATNGAPYITRTVASISSGTALTDQLLGVTNPTASNTTFYVRISTFASTNATGTPVDSGTVAASTANQISLSGYMPESLVFCTGATVGTTGGVPDCSTATSGSINFNQPFSPTDTATATSQMAASTNAATGYNITENGATLTSGSNTVTPMAVLGTGTRGTSQFGINLRANTTTTSTPAVGTDLTPASNGTNLKGQALTGYSTVDNFKFLTAGDSVANSADGGAGPSDAQIFTVSYIVNANGAQAVGTYTTTLTYICTATY